MRRCRCDPRVGGRGYSQVQRSPSAVMESLGQQQGFNLEGVQTQQLWTLHRSGRSALMRRSRRGITAGVRGVQGLRV